jgi:isopentenyl diphosphate isomerase/L-lactate dehydrogenase-like FMN-dependent dehydrogenase
MTDTADPVNIVEFEAIARARMEPSAYDYYAGGAGDERTLAENRLGFDRVVFRPRVLVDVTHIDTSVDLLGARLSFPVLLAPTAFNRLGHPDGEIAAVRAAGAAGTLMVVSTMKSRPRPPVPSGSSCTCTVTAPSRSIS